jgi:hypothetical protein
MSYRYTQKEVMLNLMKGEAAHLGPTKSEPSTLDAAHSGVS